MAQYEQRFGLDASHPRRHHLVASERKQPTSTLPVHDLKVPQMAAFHATYDVLLTPALATLPPKLGWIDMMMDDVHEYWRRVFHFSPFTVCFNLTGQPAIVLPLAQSDAMPERTAAGFPISVQFVARHGDEATLFRLAAQLEKARPWFDRKPLAAM